jgi:hypothetical protein
LSGYLRDLGGSVVFAAGVSQCDGQRERQQVSQFHHFHIFPLVKSSFKKSLSYLAQAG